MGRHHAQEWRLNGPNSYSIKLPSGKSMVILRKDLRKAT